MRRAAPGLRASLLATLLNPWGWGIYRAILVQQRVNSQHEYLIAEWSRLPLTWLAIFRFVFVAANQRRALPVAGDCDHRRSLSVVALAIRSGAATVGRKLMSASHYVRMGALFACVVVVVGGPVLGEALRRTSRV